MKIVTRGVRNEHPETELEVTMEATPQGFIFTGTAQDGRRFRLTVDAPDDAGAERHMRLQAIGAWQEIAE